MLITLVAAVLLQAPLTPHSERELTQLLDGVQLAPGDEDIVIKSGGQYFLPNGRYVQPGRIYQQGTWRVAPGRLCYRIETQRAGETCIAF